MSAPQDSFQRQQVVEIISSVIQRMAPSPNSHVLDDNLLHEIHQLKEAIDALKQELNDVHPGGIQTNIPSATSELDAIVAMTETATNTIMESCELIQTALKDEQISVHKVESEIIRIVEACTFQDITGQRITKIIKFLKEIDAHAAELIRVMDNHFPGASVKPAGVHNDGEVSLMNGPQLPGQGVSQADIDALLNDLF